MNLSEKIENAINEANILVKHRVNTSNVKAVDFVERLNALIGRINSGNVDMNKMSWININRYFAKVEQEFGIQES